ncbi:MAG: DUF3575 domain-containing protein [Bacteroidales bacterium]|nr:DUF3575 domain-containing protein [Bacteroidales bacterium]
MTRLRIILLSLIPAAAIGVRARVPDVLLPDTVQIHFRQSKWDLSRTVGNNGAVLDSIDKKLIRMQSDSLFKVIRMNFVGSASPEGSVEFNRMLSEKRAETLFNYFRNYDIFADSKLEFEFRGRDWQRVLNLAEQEPTLPYRDETLGVLRSIVADKILAGGTEPADALMRIKQLHRGVPYKYLYSRIFPKVRTSLVVLDYDWLTIPKFELSIPEKTRIDFVEDVPEVETLPETVSAELPRLQDIADTVSPRDSRPFYMAVRTNMLYDSALLPNIGIDFYFGKGFTLGANVMYGWWSRYRSDFIWRAYGAELDARWFPWYKRKVHTPFYGHHFGIYTQIYTYDFEMGRKGELGGKPGGRLTDSPFWSAGLEYGFTLPVASRFSIDFSVGVGYTTGIYHDYRPDHIVGDEIHFVWQGTHRRHFFGPTKAEVALVWLIGHDNTNRKRVKAAQEGGEL